KHTPAEHRINMKQGTQSIRRIQSRMKERLINRNVTFDQQPQSNLRLGTIKCFSDDGAAFVPNPHDRPGFGLSRFRNIAAINPKVTTSNTIQTTLAYDHIPVFEHYNPPCTFQILITNYRPN